MRGGGAVRGEGVQEGEVEEIIVHEFIVHVKKYFITDTKMVILFLAINYPCTCHVQCLSAVRHWVHVHVSLY